MQKVSIKIQKRIKKNLISLYGINKGRIASNRLFKILDDSLVGNKIQNIRERFNEKDVVLITYGDMIKNEVSPLHILGSFAKRYLVNRLNIIHILPFFEYYSDRGFSIVDYKKVDPRLGDWQDIKDIKKDFKLMFDLVLNHVSDEHHWFKEFINSNPKYQNYFIWFDKYNLPSERELKKIFRPRATQLLTKYETNDGEKYVWTTFPLNQVDLNFKNEEVLFEIIDTLLLYVKNGADIIRLDAIAFVWKELGTSCVHLKQAHTIVQLFRDILDAVAPYVSIITETNVPHKVNIKYFGNGKNEAQMVYNFSLPLLVIYSIYSGDASILSKWAAGLEYVSDETTFFNFLDSHDGIGVLGAKGILSEKEINEMVKRSEDNGGFTGYKKNLDGVESPYEMNATWWSALNSNNTKKDFETQIKRYLVSRSIALCLKGVPGIYLNGLLGASNDKDGVKKTGNKRDINRKNFHNTSLLKEMQDRNSRTHKVFFKYLDLIEKRVSEKAFDPKGGQKILFLNNSVFSLIRVSPDKKDVVTALHNLSNKKQKIKLKKNSYWDIISMNHYNGNIELKPYQILWLKN